MDSFYFVLCLSLVSAATTLEFPSSIVICKKTDTDCMIEAIAGVLKLFAQGNKEFGVPTLDPLLLKKIHIPGNGGSIDLEQTYTDTYIHGLSTAVAKSVTAKISDSECSMGLQGDIGLFQMIGTYEAKGKMLLFNINGGGASNLTFVNVHYDIGLPCEIVDNGGRKHLKLKDFRLKLQGSRLILDYKNLVDNNPQLSQTVLDAMNESSDDVFKFLRKDYEKVYSEAFRGYADAIFKAVPLDKLFLD